MTTIGGRVVGWADGALPGARLPVAGAADGAAGAGGTGSEIATMGELAGGRVVSFLRPRFESSVRWLPLCGAGWVVCGAPPADGVTAMGEVAVVGFGFRFGA